MYTLFRRVFSTLKEQKSVSYAKLVTTGDSYDVDLLILKATTPDDFPLSEKYVLELLRIFSISPSSFHAFSLSFTCRFGNTRCWRVALKCILLLHHLLRSLPESSPLRAEMLWTRSNGLITLYPCHFHDDSSSSALEDFTIFVRSYARLLDEILDCFLDCKEISYHGEEIIEISLPDKIKETRRMLELLPQLQSLIDRVMDCKPTGLAAKSFIVQSAMKHIIRDSFICYNMFKRKISLVSMSLFQMPYKSCISAFGIYKKAALQAYQLCEFYDWCKAMRLCGPYEYPFVDKIPDIHVQALEAFIGDMWQLTDSSSSSSSTSPSLFEESESSLFTEEGDKQSMISTNNVIITTKWEKFEEDDDEPLIQLEDKESHSWEDLLGSLSQLGFVLTAMKIGMVMMIIYIESRRQG